MPKKRSWPKEADVRKMRESLSDKPGVHILDKERLSATDQAKFNICEQIIRYKNSHKLSQKRLAEIIGENEALISKIVRYRFQEFTLDRLMKFLNVLYPKASLQLKIAS